MSTADDGTVLLTVTISDFHPDPTRFFWTVPSLDGTTLDMDAGGSNSHYEAAEV